MTIEKETCLFVYLLLSHDFRLIDGESVDEEILVQCSVSFRGNEHLLVYIIRQRLENTIRSRIKMVAVKVETELNCHKILS